jgi:subtilisin family serine protease
VINVSLVGPDNLLLAQSIRALQRRGHLIVAAVGNDGPAAPALYPAAYEGVVGVTGVDGRRRALPEAGRGPQVRFAAVGADLPAAGLHGEYVAVRGTSFAAPIVAGLLAAALPAPDSAAAAAAVAQLAAQAVDLGARGADTTFGSGLVGESVSAALFIAHLPLSKTAEPDLRE